jgi:hypothetical protein
VKRWHGFEDTPLKFWASIGSSCILLGRRPEGIVIVDTEGNGATGDMLKVGFGGFETTSLFGL